MCPNVSMQWLEIKPTDDEKTRNRKKKLQKSFKNKKRFQDMDALTRKKQQNWQDFKTGKGAKKKVTPLIGCCFQRRLLPSLLLVLQEYQELPPLKKC